MMRMIGVIALGVSSLVVAVLLYFTATSYSEASEAKERARAELGMALALRDSAALDAMPDGQAGFVLVDHRERAEAWLMEQRIDRLCLPRELMHGNRSGACNL